LILNPNSAHSLSQRSKTFLKEAKPFSKNQNTRTIPLNAAQNWQAIR